MLLIEFEIYEAFCAFWKLTLIEMSGLLLYTSAIKTKGELDDQSRLTVLFLNKIVGGSNARE